jgi:hypothetical protein
MNLRPLRLLSLLLATAICPAQDKQPADAPGTVFSATVTIRHKHATVPERFVGYLSDRGSFVTMPIESASTPGWVVSVTTDLHKGSKDPRLDVEIVDTQRLRLRSTEQKPFERVPIRVFNTELPLEFDAEIELYKSSDLAISVQIKEVLR